MRYLRMLTNSMLAGVLAAMYLTVLVLQLNPHVPVVSATAWRWFLALLAMYGPYLTAALLLLILAREALASRPLQPGWLSLRDRKSTRLNSSHSQISYAVFCSKKK